MAEINPNAITTPKTTMQTELWYSTSASYTNLTQIFMVQEIPQFDPPKEPVVYGSLESTTEFQTEGTKKAETITVPLLYVEEQHTELKELENDKTKVYFIVKLPNSTVASGQPKCFKFSGTVSLALDPLTQGDNMIQESLNIFKDSIVTEDTWVEPASL